MAVYDGSIEKRTRLIFEVATAVSSKIGADHIGVRLSPVSPANDSKDSDPQGLFNHVVERLNHLNLAYIHIVEGATGETRNYLPYYYKVLKQRFEGTWMVNNG